MAMLLARFQFTHPIHLVVGLMLWSLWFVGVYSGLSVACAVAPPPPEAGAFTGLNAALGGVSLITAVGFAVLAWGGGQAAKQHQGRQRFHATVSAWLYLFSAFGVVFAGMPIISVPPCL
ncbi:hypothetical protein ELY33_13805 [Vreelandella andesensis]|uniref:Uncharacterized protein n=1 Tax=Vreelandella andesensis TaxID=447567 RepID=A0A3S0YF66_9GAMM|nr:hypothetical protein [Halomonas andesensis]RUR28618.1 hypothetical protein ELY33_13805 [Halomonas andesensis]